MKRPLKRRSLLPLLYWLFVICWSSHSLAAEITPRPDAPAPPSTATSKQAADKEETKPDQPQPQQSRPLTDWFTALPNDVLAELLMRHRNRLRQIYHLTARRPLPGTPDPARLRARLRAKGLRRGSPVFIRIFKLEGELELWLWQGRQRKFMLFARYPVCSFSGRLGPKQRQGDQQAPEGFYTVTKGQLNPKSRYYLSFNLGYPNLYDRQLKRTGNYLMVHGHCVSLGCYAMTDPVIGEIWKLITAALNRGQPRIHVHIFPFRPAPFKAKLFAGHQWRGFWQDLQPAYDLFERHRRLPRITVCRKRYRVFSPSNRSRRVRITPRALYVSCR